MTPDRRQLIAAAGALAGSGMLLPGSAEATPLNPPVVNSPIRPTVAIADDRYSEGQRFLAACAAAGAEALPARADVAALWYGRLGKQVIAADIRLVGLTTYADFHLIQGCAAEARQKLALVIGHDSRDGATRHAAQATAVALDLNGLTRSGGRWVEALAASLAGRPTRPCPVKEAAASRPVSLWSWVIA